MTPEQLRHMLGETAMKILQEKPAFMAAQMTNLEKLRRQQRGIPQLIAACDTDEKQRELRPDQIADLLYKVLKIQQDQAEMLSKAQAVILLMTLDENFDAAMSKIALNMGMGPDALRAFAKAKFGGFDA